MYKTFRRTEWREKMFSERVEEIFIQKSKPRKVSFWYLTIEDKSER